MSTLKTVAIVIAVIVVVIILFYIIGFVVSLVRILLELAILAGVGYVVYLVVRKRPSKPE